jgi:hypothetical protein
LAAHESSAAGDHDAARRYIDAALAIDPAFAAAVSLKDSFPSPPAPTRAATEQATPEPETLLLSAAAPMVSAEGWARFEQRARARRVERRIAAARSALATREVENAEAAITEVEELSPDHTELPWLREQLLAAREVHAPRRRWVAVAAAAAALLLVATQLEKYPRLLATASRDSSPLTTVPPANQDVRYDAQEPQIAPVPAAPAVGARVAPSLSSTPRFDAAIAPQPRADSGSANAKERTPQVVPPEIPVGAVGAVGERTELPARPVRSEPVPTSPTTVVLNAPDVRTLPIATTATPVAAPIERPAPTERPTPSDDQQVRQVLQRYRQAYGSLNARSAQDVWPGVDAAALARAFDALESQELIFDDCRVDVTASEAMATCHGSARFVPRVGGRQVRTEARVWDFRLLKTAAGWQIATARVGR